MKIWPTIASALEAHGTCALVSLIDVEGSAPREAGARLIVTPQGFHGTIGGGALEWRAIAEAQARMGKGPSVNFASQALGPELGQCCGGRVRMLTEIFDRSMLADVNALAAQEERGAFASEGHILADRIERRIVPLPALPLDRGKGIELNSLPPLRGRVREGGRPSKLIEQFGEDRRPIYLFGAGHVGRALILALAPLPFDVRWIDSRPDAFPAAVPANVTTVFSAAPGEELANAPAHAFILVMTHSHALDLAIIERAMRGKHFGYIGLIGSSTKRARFAARLKAGGMPENRIADLVCPIGAGVVTGKHPAIIAAATAVQLLERDELLRGARNPLAAAAEPSKMAAGRA